MEQSNVSIESVISALKARHDAYHKELVNFRANVSGEQRDIGVHYCEQGKQEMDYAHTLVSALKQSVEAKRRDVEAERGAIVNERYTRPCDDFERGMLNGRLAQIDEFTLKLIDEIIGGKGI